MYIYFFSLIVNKISQVEVLSHYGTEHFCPISLFRVYGNNEYEFIDNQEETSGEPEVDSTAEEMLTNPDKTPPPEKSGNLM